MVTTTQASAYDRRFARLLRIFETIKKYNRPARCVLWSLTIVISFFSIQEYTDNHLKVIGLMFLDMGVYAAGRTYEKINNIQDGV